MPGLLEQAHDPLAQQHRVLGDDYAHRPTCRRHLARTTVPPPAGSRPPARRRAPPAGRPGRAGPSRRGVGAADAVVGHLHRTRAVARADADRRVRWRRRTWRRWSAPRRRRSRRRPRPAPAARSARPSPRRGAAPGRPAPRAPPRRPRSVSTAGVDAARQLAQLVGRLRQLRDRLVEQLRRPAGSSLDLRAREPQVQRQRDEPLLRAVVEVALERAGAPRSPPRRSARASARSSSTRARSSASRRSFSSASPRPRAARSAPALLEERVVDDRGDRLPSCAHLGRGSPGPGPGS